MKYLLYRAPRSLYRDIRKHELIAVEHGRDIGDVAGALVKDVWEDLSCMPAHAHCLIHAYAPKPTILLPLAKRYPYEINGYVAGVCRNSAKCRTGVLRFDYGIMEIQE